MTHCSTGNVNLRCFLYCSLKLNCSMDELEDYKISDLYLNAIQIRTILVRCRLHLDNTCVTISHLNISTLRYVCNTGTFILRHPSKSLSSKINDAFLTIICLLMMIWYPGLCQAGRENYIVNISNLIWKINA